MSRELTWAEGGHSVTKLWVSESDFSLPKTIFIGDDKLTADLFHQKASEGAGFVYNGDFQNAKQLLQAVKRRIDKNSETASKKIANHSAQDIFNKYRQTRSHRAQILSRLLICVETNLTINLRRAPDVAEPIKNAIADAPQSFVVSLHELLGFIGAFEWKKKGVYIRELENKIYPHYGVFSPVRGEYLSLIEKAPLPAPLNCAFDIGTGTGVIAALLAKRGINNIIGTDTDSRALLCAQENFLNLKVDKQIKLQNVDLFPDGTADLIICNPPWLPGRPTSRIENAIYDEDSKMLNGFIENVGKHLTKNGEAWLIISNLAELLGLRAQNHLNDLFLQGQLRVIDCLEAKPFHQKVSDVADPLHFARSKEITRLWRLQRR